jgi:hypothetical protein
MNASSGAAASRRQLELIGEIAALARTVGAELWLRGGWAMDFFLGRVTRQHDDIDLFTLEPHIAALAECGTSRRRHRSSANR